MDTQNLISLRQQPSFALSVENKPQQIPTHPVTQNPFHQKEHSIPNIYSHFSPHLTSKISNMHTEDYKYSCVYESQKFVDDTDLIDILYSQDLPTNNTLTDMKSAYQNTQPMQMPNTSSKKRTLSFTENIQPYHKTDDIKLQQSPCKKMKSNISSAIKGYACNSKQISSKNILPETSHIPINKYKPAEERETDTFRDLMTFLDDEIIQNMSPSMGHQNYQKISQNQIPKTDNDILNEFGELFDTEVDQYVPSTEFYITPQNPKTSSKSTLEKQINKSNNYITISDGNLGKIAAKNSHSFNECSNTSIVRPLSPHRPKNLAPNIIDPELKKELIDFLEQELIKKGSYLQEYTTQPIQKSSDQQLNTFSPMIRNQKAENIKSNISKGLMGTHFIENKNIKHSPLSNHIYSHLQIVSELRKPSHFELKSMKGQNTLKSSPQSNYSQNPQRKSSLQKSGYSLTPLSIHSPFTSEPFSPDFIVPELQTQKNKSNIALSPSWSPQMAQLSSSKLTHKSPNSLSMQQSPSSYEQKSKQHNMKLSGKPKIYDISKNIEQNNLSYQGLQTEALSQQKSSQTKPITTLAPNQYKNHPSYIQQPVYKDSFSKSRRPGSPMHQKGSPLNKLHHHSLSTKEKLSPNGYEDSKYFHQIERSPKGLFPRKSSKNNYYQDNSRYSPY